MVSQNRGQRLPMLLCSDDVFVVNIKVYRNLCCGLFPHTVPSSSPLFFSSSMVTSTSFRVTWQPPSPQDHNGIITYYRLHVENQRSLTSRFITVQPSSIPYTVRNVSPFTVYNWSVAAATVNGTGPYSSDYSVQTLVVRKSPMLLSSINGVLCHIPQLFEVFPWSCVVDLNPYLLSCPGGSASRVFA